MSGSVRVRLAPSPTGYFHVGTARTAIYNYLFARRLGGTFVLRIEDTDLDRSERRFVDVILDGLTWLGASWDEGPYYQSERAHLYGPPVQQLLQSGRAYRCFCTTEDLEGERESSRAAKLDWKYSRKCLHLDSALQARYLSEGRPAAVRLKVPDGLTTSFEDVVGGTMARKNDDIEDFVIARSDGTALYNFAVVIDDHLMEISHVIRGNDHITNTYKQCLLYDALEWPRPVFAHLPLILREDRSKVSKRKGDPSVTDYRDRGYLPEALLNYLCLLGWSAGDDREVFSLQELVEAFELERVTASNPVFDAAKLEWLNGEYIRSLPVDKLASLAAPWFEKAGLCNPSGWEQEGRFQAMIGLLQERAKTLMDFPRIGRFFYVAPAEYDPEGVQLHFTVAGVPEKLAQLADRWGGLDPFEAPALDSSMRELAKANGEKLGAWIHPARLALTGSTAGPGLFELAALLGSSECTLRLRSAAESIERGLITRGEAHPKEPTC
jgi:nondiscriminating glutamyl-tRNA synthetase